MGLKTWIHGDWNYIWERERENGNTSIILVFLLLLWGGSEREKERDALSEWKRKVLTAPIYLVSSKSVDGSRYQNVNLKMLTQVKPSLFVVLPSMNLTFTF